MNEIFEDDYVDFSKKEIIKEDQIIEIAEIDPLYEVIKAEIDINEEQSS